LAARDYRLCSTPQTHSDARLFVLEDEYKNTITEAELSWLAGVIRDLTPGKLTWSRACIQEVAHALSRPSD
jgi:hypothetical protein